MFQAERFARDLMRAGARNRHPEWNEADVEKEVARLWLDRGYVDRWAKAKGLTEIWKAVLARTKE